MATNTMIALDTITLTSNGGAVTFTNIPQNYTHLRLVIKGGFVDNGFLFGVRVGNGSVDSGSNYSYQTLRGNGSSAAAMIKTNMVMGALCQQGASNLNNVITVTFPNYSNTSFNKTWLSRYANASEGVDSITNYWRSTAAINTISIAESGDGGSGVFNYSSMLSGTTFALYGIKAWEPEASTKATGGYVYSDSTYYYHSFPFSGTFTPNQSLTADILVVAGGGGAGGSTVSSGIGRTGGGAGGGGIAYYSSQSLTATGYSCVVGGGGTGGSNDSANGSQGVNSQFASLTAAVGGGYGAKGNANSGANNGGSGGSGGGAGGNNSGSSGGSATSGQGNIGGAGSSDRRGSGGGGGAGAAGQAGESAQSGAGGNGTSTYSSWCNVTGVGQNILGTYYLAGGGGGGSNEFGSTGGAGGYGGGGKGGNNIDAGVSGIPGTGGGGGAGGAYSAGTANTPGGNGGSGVIIIRYAK